MRRQARARARLALFFRCVHRGYEYRFLCRGVTVVIENKTHPSERFGAPVVRMENICKNFKSVCALANVPFQLAAGEIRGLVGENGAGKSTLMNILYGMYSASSGSIECFGKKLPSRWTSIQAINNGIGMIHQHFSTVPVYTVLENVVLPTLKWTDFKPNWKAYEETISALAQEYDFHLDMHKRVESLSVGEKQQLEILKALYQGARILILDEPTGVLTPQQADNLLRFLVELKNRGLSVVIVTHKLEEAMQVCDTITVLRAGRYIDTVLKDETTPHDIARMMIERDYIAGVENNTPPESLSPVLDVQNLCVRNEHGGLALNKVSFTVNKGEIVGVVGVSGNGQAELVECIVGLEKLDSGSIIMNGEDIGGWGIRKRREAGLGYIPEDRHRTGLVLELSVAENLILDRLSHRPFAQNSFVQPKSVHKFASECIRDYRVKTPGGKEMVGNLSGGNQQKVVLARTITAQPQVIISSQPTWGLDFGATEFVRGKLVESARAGAGVLLISSDLDELLELSHRLLVIYEGRIAGVINRADVDIDQLGLMMTGVSEEKKAN